ncbi:hypothetical protein [Kineosporia sp. A_224]|uniref:hypothetical protein n=1 Tax=Kineosporia sp. A_224 TaxID=1962180 RepID=UPI000B4BCDA2|nr:hypothetical protein [Kineosporia sp. A_224]
MSTPSTTTKELPRDECLTRTYTYLRLAIVMLLLALGAAIVIQTWQQGWHPLASVSAYYYTSAQALFVSTLVGFAACMIALRGTRTVEDVTLNLAGMFAVLVGIVPTSRGEDYRAAVRSCRDVAVALSTKPLDCPTVRSLEKAAQADIKTSVGAFLTVGFLSLGAALVLHARRGSSTPVRSPFTLGFALVAGLWTAVAVTFSFARGWFTDNAHYLSAIGLAVCILVIALANARRHSAGHAPLATSPDVRTCSDPLVAHAPSAVVAATTATRTDVTPDAATNAGPAVPDRYTLVAVGLLLVLIAGGTLWALGAFSLFWLEVGVALMFTAFWVVQTHEDPVTQDNRRDRAESTG